MIKRAADYLVKKLKEHGFKVMRYDAYSTNSELLHIHGAIKTCVTCDKGEKARKALEGE